MITKTEPEYVDLKFKNDADLQKWLKKTTRYKVEFQDQGQDLMGFWIDEGGEILQTDLASLGRIYNGQIVDTETIEEGELLEIFNFNSTDRLPTDVIKYPIEKVEYAKRT